MSFRLQNRNLPFLRRKYVRCGYRRHRRFNLRRVFNGDADTLTAIAETLHGIPDKIIAQTERDYLNDDSDILEVIQEMYQSGEM